AGKVPTRTLGGRRDEALAEVRLFPLRRRTPPVHRKRLCADGGDPSSGDHCPEIPLAADGQSSSGATGVDYLAASARREGVARKACQPTCAACGEQGRAGRGAVGSGSYLLQEIY